MNSSERLVTFLTYKGISKRSFYQSTGLSNGYLDKTKGVGAEVLERIISIYPELSIIWVVSGKGEMINNPPQTGVVIAESEAKNTIPLVKNTEFAPKNAPPIAPPIRDLGLPKVIVVDRNNEEGVPLVGVKAAAGYLNGFADPEYISLLPIINTPNIKGGTHRAFEIRGNSMYPTFHSGDIVIGRWEESLESIRDRRIYIVVTKNDGIVIKRVLNRMIESGKLILISDSDNKLEHPNYTVSPEDVLELWYWRAAIKMEAPEPSRIWDRINNLEAVLTLHEERLAELGSKRKK